MARVGQRHLKQTELLETIQVYNKAQECLPIKIIQAVTVTMGMKMVVCFKDKQHKTNPHGPLKFAEIWGITY